MKLGGGGTKRRGPQGSVVVRSVANLAGWLNEPYVKNAVIAVLERSGQPMLMREVADASGYRVRSVNRVLLRLHKKGLATRYKLPIQRHAYCRKSKRCVPYGATRMLFA